MSNKEGITGALEACRMWRERGNQAYTDGCLQEAEYFYTRGIASVPFEERCNCELRFCFSNRATTRMSLGKITEAYDDCVQAYEIDLKYIKNRRVTVADCQLALEETNKASRYYNAQSDGIDSKTLAKPREGFGKNELSVKAGQNGVKIPCIEPQNFLSKELHSANGGCAMNFPLLDAFMPPMRWNNGAKVVPSNDAVLKVFCTHSEPNFSLPWQMKRQYSSTSSGFAISGRRVLTNAHSVHHYTQVKLKKRSSDTKYIATVLAIGNECDIAMLTVNDDEFWEDIQPVEFGSLPAQQDAVTVVGYPMGGDNISVTSGVVSRIEIFSYLHGSAELLGLQVDAAINSGNSGGPVFNNKGQCVGIAFQKGEDADNIGYVIPNPVIMHFIADYEKFGQYTGFPILGIAWQDMENPDLRKAMGMKPYQKGIRVRRVEPTASEYGRLKPSDIILSFDGVDIANDGTVPFMHGERIGFSYLVSQKYTGEKAVITVLRDSKVLEFTINLGIHKRLIPTHINGRPPSYYIVAGFVFTYVTIPYLDELDTDTPVKLLDKQLYAMAQSEDEELVVVSQVLAADINVGYEHLENIQVISFNSKPVKNLKGLVQMVEECNEEFLKFDLEHQLIVVLETKRAKEATHDILKANFIPSAMSDDLKAENN